MDQPMSEPPSPLKVLLIDDEEDDAILTRACLEKTFTGPVEFDWASTFQEGLNRISADQHDIHFLDYDLGHRTGLDLLHELSYHTFHAPIIMLTGHGNEILAVQALQSGAVDYIPKDLLSTQHLQRAVHLAFEASRRQAETMNHQQYLERTNKDLRKKNFEIQRFYHILTHELMAPLSAALELVNMMQEGISGSLNTDQQSDLRLINNCCLQVKHSMNDLYDITQMEMGKVTIAVNSAPLPPLVGEVLAQLESKASAQGISLQFHLDENLPNVQMDTERMTMVFCKLIENSMKFTPRGGIIRIHGKMDRINPSLVRIEIHDNGLGIPTDQQENIFEQFYPLTSVGNSKSIRLGLSVLICRKLLHLHGTTLAVHHQLGKGSIYAFSLKAVH